MWTAEEWNEYEVLDTSSGEKLERWGDYVLIRPDPQVIWDTPHLDPSWKKAHGHYHRSDRGGGEWEFMGLPGDWEIHYKDLTFRLKPMNFKHTGLFPEQAVNWDWMRGLIEREVSSGRQVRVLNLFAYTGGATVACAKAGARVTHVDAARGMVSWAKENAQASGLADAPIRYLVDDCLKFVERELRRGNRYEAVIMDPPSYGRGPKGETWKLESILYPFLQKAVSLLSDEPMFVLLNSYTTGLQPAAMKYLLELALEGRPGEGEVSADEIGLPVSGGRHILPCGASARWKKTT